MDRQRMIELGGREAPFRASSGFSGRHVFVTLMQASGCSHDSPSWFRSAGSYRGRTAAYVTATENPCSYNVPSYCWSGYLERSSAYRDHSSQIGHPQAVNLHR